MTLFRDGIACETHDGIRVRKGIPMGWSDEIYGRAECPLCRLLVELGDTNMSGGKREVEFWSIVTLKGREIYPGVAEPLHEMVEGVETSLQGVPLEAIYLALVRSVKAPPSYGFEYRTVFKDMTFIGLLGAEESIPDRSLSFRSTGDAADVTKRVREWLERCCKHETCPASKAALWSSPDGFRLFDINSAQVVNSRGQEPYIALSYVWAQIDKVDIIERGVPYAVEDLPKVLQDVIGVVRGLELGINHIWMDQLCMDQEVSDQRRKNINAMGAIYGAAFATIILAVPSRGGAEQGLPGISVPRKSWQRVETIGNLKLATTLPSLDMAISTSQWNSRGWTLEEGILSNRCILFGPEQVYFECKEMACSESIQEPSLTASQQNHLVPCKSRLHNPFLHSYDFDTLYWRLIQDYTGRDMTHDKDALNAFSAFAAEFERDGHRVCWGLPATGIVRHLLWEHGPWDLRDVRRRDGFPSWSWAGWYGTAVMNVPLDAFSNATYSCTVIEEPLHGQIIACSARTVRVALSGQPPICSIMGVSASSVMMDCGINVGPGFLPKTCVLMEICRIDDTIHGLLLKSLGENYERIGSGFVSLPDTEAMGLQWQDLKLV